MSGLLQDAAYAYAQVNAVSVRLVTLKGISTPVKFDGCDELIDGLGTVLRGWEIQDVPTTQPARAQIRVTRTVRGYRRVSSRFNTPSRARKKIRRTTVAGLCGLHCELIDWHVDANEGMLCLHCAAAKFGDGLVLFPTTFRTGKSTLSTYMAAAGHRVFCDDVLPIDPDTDAGVAPGIVPRIRLPLPDNMGVKMRQYLASRSGPANHKYMYVNLNAQELAPLGEQAPIRGIVMLQRRARGKASLLPVSKHLVLEEVIAQNIARKVGALELLDTLHRVVENAQCYTLRYSRGGPAVKALQAVFNHPLSAADIPDQTPSLAVGQG